MNQANEKKKEKLFDSCAVCRLQISYGKYLCKPHYDMLSSYQKNKLNVTYGIFLKSWRSKNISTEELLQDIKNLEDVQKEIKKFLIEEELNEQAGV